MFGIIADFIWVAHGCSGRVLFARVDHAVNRGTDVPARFPYEAVDPNHVLTLGVGLHALWGVDDLPFKGVFFLGQVIPDLMQDIERGLMQGQSLV
jgi:hypothetical protein